MELQDVLRNQYGPFMDIKELASLLRVKHTTIYNQIYEGKFQISNIRHGKKYLFPTDGVAEHLENKLDKVG